MKRFETKEEAQNYIKGNEVPEAFTMVYESSHYEAVTGCDTGWYIMSVVTRKYI